MAGNLERRFLIGFSLMFNLVACSLTPPAEYQAYDGPRRDHADHAVILNNGGAFVVRVDDRRTGGMAQGGYPDTVFVLPGLRRIHLNSRGHGASADSVIICVEVKAGGVYSARATRLPEDPVYYARLWLRDNHSDLESGTAVGMTEECG